MDFNFIYFIIELIIKWLLQGGITSPQPLTILAIDPNAAESDPESGLLGTDFTFFTAFLRMWFV